MGTIGRGTGNRPYDVYDKAETVSKAGVETITGQKTFIAPVKVADATLADEAVNKGQLDTKLPSSSYTASDVLAKIRTVDGSGSGLDADLLDGKQSSTGNVVNTVAVRDYNGDINARLLRTEWSGGGWNRRYLLGINVNGGVGTDNFARPTHVNAGVFIGVGQTWRDVTASRALGVTYTNNTGKPIVVNIRVNRNAVSTAGVRVVVNGISVEIGINTNSGGGNIAIGNIIIPKGVTYVAYSSAEPASLNYWHELR